ncbi:hypothetical protein WJ62_05675 [Burkholderia diffusa]|nr:hypothetical protein WJ62_05675 [Burkholderia diffusa]
MARTQFDIDVAADVMNVIDSYLQVVSASKRVETAKDSLAAMRATLSAVQNFVATGRSSAAEARQAQFGVSQATATLHLAEAALQSAQLNLAPLLGCSSADTWAVSDIDAKEQAWWSAETPTIDELPDVRLKRLAVEDAEAALDVAKNALLPDLSVSASLSNTPTTPVITTATLGSLRLLQKAIAFTLSVPLNDYESKAAVSSTRQRLHQAEHNLDQTILNSSASLRDAQLAIDSAQRQLELARQQQTQAESVLADEESKLKLGKSSLLQLQTAQANQVSSRLAMNDAAIGMWRSRLHYRQVTGQLLSILGISSTELEDFEHE